MTDIARCVRTACLWEATARKAGNVHPEAEFADLKYADFVHSGEAIAPVLDELRGQPIGVTVLEAIHATRRVVSTNTNLGILLLLAPLSKVKTNDSLRRNIQILLNASTIDDAKHVYEAIRLAVPGGMGRVEKQDVAAEPTQTLNEVMTLAADRDMVARQYMNGFADLFDHGVPSLLHGWETSRSVEAAILACQIHLLAAYPDSLIARKCGLNVAEDVRRRAQAIEQAAGLATVSGRRLYADLDRWLRADGHARNPGTTADFVTACLFIALRERKMSEQMPFAFHELNQ